jgi:hypothetical protein
MGILRSFDRRREARTNIDLVLMVWGVDTRGERFVQEAHARDISLSGALLAGLDAELRSEDVAGILYGSRKARFGVIWVRYHRADPDVCPWRELLVEESADTASPAEIRPSEQLPPRSLRQSKPSWRSGTRESLRHPAPCHARTPLRLQREYADRTRPSC